MQAPPPRIPLAKCNECGRDFLRDKYNRRYCSTECRIKHTRAGELARVKAIYWADPEQSRAKMRAYFAAHREEHKVHQRKANARTCEVCGETRSRGDWPREVPFVCLKCQTVLRRVANKGSCRYCGDDVFPSNGSLPAFCGGCFGLLTRLAEKWGISREGVRHRMLSAQRRAAGRGITLTPREALALVESEQDNKTLPVELEERVKAASVVGPTKHVLAPTMTEEELAAWMQEMAVH